MKMCTLENKLSTRRTSDCCPVCVTIIMRYRALCAVYQDCTQKLHVFEASCLTWNSAVLGLAICTAFDSSMVLPSLLPTSSFAHCTWTTHKKESYSSLIIFLVLRETHNKVTT